MFAQESLLVHSLTEYEVSIGHVCLKMATLRYEIMTFCVFLSVSY